MREIFLGDEEGDMKWLRDVHGCPPGMACGVLRGNEDAPERVEAWRVYNPPHDAAPDWVYVSPSPNPYYSDAEGRALGAGREGA